MTDIEIVRACAEVVGWENFAEGALGYYIVWNGNDRSSGREYDPLHDDAQAMALVKKTRVAIDVISDGRWSVCWRERGIVIYNDDLNRAIAECVYKLWKARG